MFSLSAKGKAAVVVPTGFITAQSGIEKKIREKLVEEKMLRGVVSMPSNIFATTGTNVSILFIDKTNTKGDIVLMDASKLGTTVKEGKNQKTLLSPEEEELIINTFNKHKAVEDFTVVVSYEQIKEKNYSFSAGQYFDVKIEYTDITPKEFETKMKGFKNNLDKFFEESKDLEKMIKQQLNVWSMKSKYSFKQIVLQKGGFLRGPFGGDLKKEIFVEKSTDTYKVYEQGVILNSDKSIGRYYISEKDYNNKLHKFSVQDKDFLVSCSGVNMGAIYQLKDPFEKGIINQALLRIRLNPELIDDNYFYYLFKKLISKKITSGSGDSTIPNFPGLDVIKNIELELPLKDTQEKIGKILYDIDSKIELNNRINAELEAMAKTLYDYWFVQFDFPDKKGKPYKTSGGKMVWNEELKREIPLGWKVVKIDEVISVKDGTHDSPKINESRISFNYLKKFKS